MVETLVGVTDIQGRLMEDPEYLKYTLETLQQEVGYKLVSHLWNSTTPVVVEVKPEEARPLDRFDWDYKQLRVKVRVNPVHINHMNLEYHMAGLSDIVRVPHFQYFPKDWVCEKCGCIVDGYQAPRLCDRCGAPRSPRAAMVEARGSR